MNGSNRTRNGTRRPKMSNVKPGKIKVSSTDDDDGVRGIEEGKEGARTKMINRRKHASRWG